MICLKHQQGFTLIELVVVIVVLGILATVAVPRFINLRTEANVVKMESLAGAIESAMTMAFVACQLNPNCNTNNAAGQANTLIDVGLTQNVSFHYGYPNSSDAGIVRMLVLSGFNITGSSPNPTQFRLLGPINNNCRVRYTRSSGAGQRPIVERFLTACN